MKYAVFIAMALVLILPLADPALSFWNARMDILTPAFSQAVPIRLFEPPARKAILVDAEGFAQTTADGIHMTKRDRSRVLLLLMEPKRRGIPVYLHPDANKTPVMTEGTGTAERSPIEQRLDLNSETASSA